MIQKYLIKQPVYIRKLYEQVDINFSQICDKNKNTKRSKINVLNFNAPFCKSVATQVGKCFLSIVDKNFTKYNPYSKDFNRKTLKISYCRQNMKQQIMTHNQRIPGNNEEKKQTNVLLQKTRMPIDRNC